MPVPQLLQGRWLSRWTNELPSRWGWMMKFPVQRLWPFDWCRHRRRQRQAIPGKRWPHPEARCYIRRIRNGNLCRILNNAGRGGEYPWKLCLNRKLLSQDTICSRPSSKSPLIFSAPLDALALCSLPPHLQLAGRVDGADEAILEHKRELGEVDVFGGTPLRSDEARPFKGRR